MARVNAFVLRADACCRSWEEKELDELHAIFMCVPQHLCRRE
jgi:hypothetical protein